MQKFWSAFNTFESAVMVIGMLIMVFFNFFNVICRYLFPKSPFSYTEELVVIIFMWVTMFGLSYGYRKGAHTMLDVFTNLFPRKLQFVTVIFSTLCSILLMVLMVKIGYGMVANQISHGQVTSGMRLPMALTSASLPIGGAVTIISVLKTGYDEILGMMRNDLLKNEGKEGNE